MDIDLADPAFWERPVVERQAAFAELRQRDKPIFVTEQRATRRHCARGYYAIARHAHVTEVSRNSAVFSSATVLES